MFTIDSYNIPGFIKSEYICKEKRGSNRQMLTRTGGHNMGAGYPHFNEKNPCIGKGKKNQAGDRNQWTLCFSFSEHSSSPRTSFCLTFAYGGWPFRIRYFRVKAIQFPICVEILGRSFVSPLYLLTQRQPVPFGSASLSVLVIGGELGLLEALGHTQPDLGAPSFPPKSPYPLELETPQR